jgi:hypothetical protein
MSKFRDALEKILEIANTNPFCSIGHVVEHSIGLKKLLNDETPDQYELRGVKHTRITIELNQYELEALLETMPSPQKELTELTQDEINTALLYRVQGMIIRDCLEQKISTPYIRKLEQNNENS